MVSILLRGGLGNQLFQYATGRAHAIRTESDLFIDTSRLERERSPNVAKRSLHIDAFDLSEHYMERTSTFDVGSDLFERIPRLFASVTPRLATRLFNLYVEDDPQEFDPGVLELPGDITLNGYWQSEQYFDEYADTLRDEITVSTPPRGKNETWYDRIQDANSVSVHIRRGDYVSLGYALPRVYYRTALDQIHRKTGADTLFFFSDDMAWVREHSQGLLPERGDLDVNYVECNDGETAHEDLRLMRSCDHHVIANSTFSWWGAWLDKTESKHVIAPASWFDTPVDQLDIIPDRWTTVDWGSVESSFGTGCPSTTRKNV